MLPNTWFPLTSFQQCYHVPQVEAGTTAGSQLTETGPHLFGAQSVRTQLAYSCDLPVNGEWVLAQATDLYVCMYVCMYDAAL
jgi:hypothetical protein